MGYRIGVRVKVRVRVRVRVRVQASDVLHSDLVCVQIAAANG